MCRVASGQPHERVSYIGVGPVVIDLLKEHTMIANAVNSFTVSNAVEAKSNASSAGCEGFLEDFLQHVEAFIAHGATLHIYIGVRIDSREYIAKIQG